MKMGGNMRSKRFEVLSKRPVNKETFVSPLPEAGLIPIDSPGDPKPGLIMEEGRITKMDGVARPDFDMLDRFIADSCIDIEKAEKAMATDSLDIARMMVDINVARQEVLDITLGCTPAKLVDIVRHMNVLEMMMGLAKLRARKSPANQAHVTNRQDNPALLAADAAEAALRGFDELETTVGVARYAPLNALAILVGSQATRGGVLTQCAVEESINLALGFKGFTNYSETLSVYGTEMAFVDGDDTPWSKAFLASAYASRGVKTRFTSGTSSEALMGHAEGKSMLYLEARCIMLSRGAGSQGVQNGAISCIALTEAFPGGVRVVLAENLIAMMLGLEVAAGNDALSSHSEMRKTAKLMLQLIPGADFITSGYGSIPRYDNMFGGGNFDATELDDWYVIQRDMQLDGGLVPVSEDAVLKAREKAVRALQAVFKGLGLPPITDEEVRAATTANTSQDMPARDKRPDIDGAHWLLNKEPTVLDVIRALNEGGYAETARNVLALQQQRAMGDYLQPSAIFRDGFNLLSVHTDPNDYQGPGSGYRLEGERWEKIADLPQAWDPRDFMDDLGEAACEPWLEEVGPADVYAMEENCEVVLALDPALGKAINKTIGGLNLKDVVMAIVAGVEDEGEVARIIRVPHTSDCAFVGATGSSISGSGVAIGLQAKGTTVVHCRYMPPLSNLELFSQAPNLDLETYRQIGRNAAHYARKENINPVPVKIDNTARLRLIVQTTLMHLRSTSMVDSQGQVMELRIKEQEGYHG
jgi:propanediol dehydratase large subunit